MSYDKRNDNSVKGVARRERIKGGKQKTIGRCNIGYECERGW
jgi:hypothetical protein